MMEFEKYPNLRSQITDRLFDAILQGELRPGERIVENKLARELGVGQSTLREVLQTLEQQGLITKFDNRGSFVTKLTAKDVEGMYTVRLELEPLAAVLAHKRLRPEHCARLETLLDEMQIALEQRSFTQLLKKDFAFHQSIWKLADIPSLEKALNIVCAPLFAFYMVRLSPHATADELSKAADEFAEDQTLHRELLAVLKNDDPKRVRATFRNMIQVFFQKNIDDLKSFSDAPDAVSTNARVSV